MLGNRPLGLLSLGCACAAVAVAFALTREANAPRGLAEDQLILDGGARLAQADIADTTAGTPIWLDDVLTPGVAAIPSKTAPISWFLLTHVPQSRALQMEAPFPSLSQVMTVLRGFTG